MRKVCFIKGVFKVKSWSSFRVVSESWSKHETRSHSWSASWSWSKKGFWF